MLTYAQVKGSLENNGLKKTEFHLEDGSWVRIEPCFYDDATTIEECDYFLAYHSSGLNLSNSTLDKVLADLGKVNSMLKELEKDKIELREYFEKHEAEGWSEDSWGFYSDWHKDVYGYRPHGHVCGVYVNPYTGLVEA